MDTIDEEYGIGDEAGYCTKPDYDISPDDMESDDFMPDEEMGNCSPWMRELDAEVRKEALEAQEEELVTHYRGIIRRRRGK